jgi:amino acid transporter
LSEDEDFDSTPVLFKISAAQLVSIVLIVLLTYINTKGVKGGKLIQTTFTMTKLISLFGLIGFGFLAFKGDIWTRQLDKRLGPAQPK